MRSASSGQHKLIVDAAKSNPEKNILFITGINVSKIVNHNNLLKCTRVKNCKYVTLHSLVNS